MGRSSGHALIWPSDWNSEKGAGRARKSSSAGRRLFAVIAVTHELDRALWVDVQGAPAFRTGGSGHRDLEHLDRLGIGDAPADAPIRVEEDMRLVSQGV